MHRLAAAAILVAGVLSSVAALAGELSGRGEAVIARVERPEGDRFEITVTPPPDRGVDRRVMEWLTDTAKTDDAGADDPVDVSDYHVRVEKTVSASCRTTFAIKSKPTNLAANHTLFVESETASFISVAAFPIKGDVDVRIFVGSNGDVCDASSRKKQNLDYASCTLLTCQLLAGAPRIKAEIYNATAAQATAVNLIEFNFVALP